MNAALLDVVGVSRRFGGLSALKDVSFSVREGEILGLIGPNGAGKTTVINVISGLFPPTDGRVLFRGKEIGGLPPHRMPAEGITRTFQFASVYPAVTVLENVMRGGYLAARTPLLDGVLHGPRTRLAQSRLQEFAWELLELTNLGRVGDTRAGQLSYGYQKRLGIAIALASKPSLLLLDEPAAGLNPEEGKELGRLVEDLRARLKISVLIVEHHMKLVMSLCHRLVVLDYGQKIAEGTPAEIQANPAVVDAYLGTDDDHA